VRQNKLNNGAEHRGDGSERTASSKVRRPGRPSGIVAKTAGRAESQPKQTRDDGARTGSPAQGRLVCAGEVAQSGARAPSPSANLAETIKALLLLAHGQGHVTCEDINELLPTGTSSDELEALHTRLHNLDIEIVAELGVEIRQAKPETLEPDPGRQSEVLDDPVRMYLDQMGKAPLLTQAQEVEICRRIEEAEIEMKRLVYSLGFTAKEHNAIAEKLLAEPPKERFDRIVVDAKLATREGHLANLRGLVKKMRALDARADDQYTQWQQGASPDSRERLFVEFQKLDRKLQATFPKLFYRQKILEDMIVIAGNVHEKFQASLRHIHE
jgi:RNA polymerase primary sigma factor